MLGNIYDGLLQAHLFQHLFCNILCDGDKSINMYYQMQEIVLISFCVSIVNEISVSHYLDLFSTLRIQFHYKIKTGLNLLILVKLHCKIITN